MEFPVDGGRNRHGYLHLPLSRETARVLAGTGRTVVARGAGVETLALIPEYIEN